MPVEIRRFAGPEAFASFGDKPLVVAHLTDQHVGRVTPLQVQLGAVARTNAMKPDLVVITGDFVCHSQAYLADLTEVVRAIEAPVVCVLGNHDHWSGAAGVRRALKDAHALVLDNAWSEVQVGGRALQVVGLDDAYTGHADIVKATRGLDRHKPVLGLSHIAEEADRLWELGVSLVLSGHTHAGQITVAKLHELTTGRLAGHRYVHGLYGDRRGKIARGAVYVGAGIGAAVMPLRLGERSRREVALFELGALPGAFVEHHQEQPPLKGRKPSPEVQRKRAQAVLDKAARRERRNGRPDA